MRRHGFTLIELLVVAAIISALLAILMPALGGSMESTRRAVCASREHQQFLAHVGYATGSKASMPTTNLAYGAWLWDMHETQVRRLLVHLSMSETENVMWHCPERSVVQDNPQLYWLDAAFDPYVVSGYAWFAREPTISPAMLNGYTWINRLNAAADASRAPLIADGTVFDTGKAVWVGFAHNNNARTAHINKRNEPTGGNIAYLDGSVRWKDFRDMKLNYTVGPQWWW